MEISKLVKDIYRVSRISKAGNSYQVLVVEFTNGYIFESFISNEQAFCMSSLPLK